MAAPSSNRDKVVVVGGIGGGEGVVLVFVLHGHVWEGEGIAEGGGGEHAGGSIVREKVTLKS